MGYRDGIFLWIMGNITRYTKGLFDGHKVGLGRICLKSWAKIQGKEMHGCGKFESHTGLYVHY